MSSKPSSSSSRITIDHEEIMSWVKEAGGRPAKVKTTGQGDETGVLRVDIIERDKREETLEEISWEEFFKIFEKKRLAFVYDKDGDSKFSKFIGRD